jgi:hypothetical protein
MGLKADRVAAAPLLRVKYVVHGVFHITLRQEMGNDSLRGIWKHCMLHLHPQT